MLLRRIALSLFFVAVRVVVGDDGYYNNAAENDDGGGNWASGWVNGYYNHYKSNNNNNRYNNNYYNNNRNNNGNNNGNNYQNGNGGNNAGYYQNNGQNDGNSNADNGGGDDDDDGGANNANAAANNDDGNANANAAEANYNNYNQKGGGNNAASSGGGGGSSSYSFSVCDNSVVAVRALYVSCDSPYTFYYGNGANRNSPVCNYGDKISVQVNFAVSDDIVGFDDIYMTAAIYDDMNNLLVSVAPSHLCNDFVGAVCTYAGFYGFSTRMRLPYPSESNDNSHFYPQIQMAFSTLADSGYNLGAMNVECQAWDSNGSVNWVKDAPQKSLIVSFFIEYGMLIGTCIILASVIGFVWRAAAQEQFEYYKYAHGGASDPLNPEPEPKQGLMATEID